MYTIMGMKFDDDEPKPDFGSIELIEMHNNGTNNYTLNSADEDKLNQITNAGSGSLAYCIDTRKLLMYSKPDNKWHEV